MVEGARLESEYTPKAYRGFESLPLRHLADPDQFTNVRMQYGGNRCDIGTGSLEHIGLADARAAAGYLRPRS